MLAFDKLEFPFTRGLNQKADPRLVQAPELVRAVDVEFDELGGLRLRKPFSDLNNTGLGSNLRRVYQNGDELLVFTKTELLSYVPSSSTPWKSRGTHLAIKVEEATKNATTGDQIDPDRAELSNCVVRCWTDNSVVYVVAEDKTTGATIAGPTAWGAGVAADRPRALALATKILVFANDQSASGLKAIAIDPADPATGIASAPTSIVPASDNYNLYYDVVKIPSEDSAFLVARLNPTTSYIVKKVTSALVATGSTKARTCDGPIAVSVDPTGATAQVIRANGANIQGDRITVSTLADAATGQAIGSVAGTPVNQIACAHRSVQNGGAYRCYVFWSAQEAADATDWRSEYNYVDTAGGIGAETTLVRRMGIASRAFDYNGEVYVWGVFAGASSFSGANYAGFHAQLQNSYFLYRDDGTLHAKSAFNRAGGFCPTTGRLPHVAALTSTQYAWAGTERTIIPTGTDQSNYGDRQPRDILFTFDSNEARRVARIGRTLYVTGGEIMQYDGEKLVEVGYHVYPWYFGIIEVGTGNLADGVYAYKVTQRWHNAQGERDRSTTATVGTVTIAAGPNGGSIPSWVPLYITHKTTKAPAVEVWRTAVNPTADAPFYLATSKDPSVTANPNRYIANDPTASSLPTFNDEFADSTLTTKESNNENGDTLESLAPPAATIIVANDTRLFLAGIAGAPDDVHYSKLRNEGEVAAFNDLLVVSVPSVGGAITALAFLNETLIVFRETAIYALDGRGYGNVAGDGSQNYEPRLITSDVGAVSHEAVALTPNGLVFKSNKGWYLLNRGWAVEYIGGKVCDYDSDIVYAVHVVEGQHQVRVLTNARMLMWDYLANEWAEWSISDGLHACIWNGTHHYLASAAVKAEQSSYSTAGYGWDVEMLFHLAGLQGYARVRKILVLGEVRGSGSIRFRVGDYAEGTYWDDKTWTISPTAAGSELNAKHGPSRQQGKAFRVRLTSHTTSGEKPKLSAITLEVGLKKSVYPRLPAAQRS